METWAPGQSTDVEYQDVYVVTANGSGELSIYCTTHEQYTFSDIAVTDSGVSFVLHNDIGDGVPTTISYALSYDGSNRLSGTAMSSKLDGPTNVLWVKQL